MGMGRGFSVLHGVQADMGPIQHPMEYIESPFLGDRVTGV
jgi:hypothetical protein